MKRIIICKDCDRQFYCDWKDPELMKHERDERNKHGTDWKGFHEEIIWKYQK